MLHLCQGRKDASAQVRASQQAARRRKPSDSSQEDSSSSLITLTRRPSCARPAMAVQRVDTSSGESRTGAEASWLASDSAEGDRAGRADRAKKTLLTRDLDPTAQQPLT